MRAIELTWVVLCCKRPQTIRERRLRALSYKQQLCIVKHTADRETRVNGTASACDHFVTCSRDRAVFVKISWADCDEFTFRTILNMLLYIKCELLLAIYEDIWSSSSPIVSGVLLPPWSSCILTVTTTFRITNCFSIWSSNGVFIIQEKTSQQKRGIFISLASPLVF